MKQIWPFTGPQGGWLGRVGIGAGGRGRRRGGRGEALVVVVVIVAVIVVVVAAADMWPILLRHVLDGVQNLVATARCQSC